MKTTKMKISILLIIAFTFVSNITLASSNQDSISHGEALHNSGVNPHGEVHEHLIEKKTFGPDYIIDHVVDSYGWHIMDWPTDDPNKFRAVEVHLPVILFDGGLKTFWSGDFHHGHSIKTIGDKHYMLFNNKVYSTTEDGEMTMVTKTVVPDPIYNASLQYMTEIQKVMAEAMHKDSIRLDTIATTHHDWLAIIDAKKADLAVLSANVTEGEDCDECKSLENEITVLEKAKLINSTPWDFSITKNVFALFITVLIMLLFFLRTARYYRKKGALVAPKGMAAVMEPLIVFVRDDIARPNIGEAQYKRFMPYLLTVFFFIWISNMVGLLPLGFNLTGNIGVTFVLAFFTMILTNLNGKRKYWGHIFNPLGNSMPPLAKGLLYIILVPIEMVGIIAKPFALM
ncbi:MAG: F0F1-type ATP synthase membrane subunit a, partial [Parvicellaceae bacterium]